MSAPPGASTRPWIGVHYCVCIQYSRAASHGPGAPADPFTPPCRGIPFFVDRVLGHGLRTVPVMNAPLRPDVFTRVEPSPQLDLPLAAHGVQRHVWESGFGTMLIEVRDGQIFVNGRLVEPAVGHGPASGSA